MTSAQDPLATFLEGLQKMTRSPALAPIVVEGLG